MYTCNRPVPLHSCASQRMPRHCLQLHVSSEPSEIDIAPPTSTSHRSRAAEPDSATRRRHYVCPPLCLPATLSVLTRRSLAAKSILLCRLSLRNVAAHADLGHHTQQRDATTTATRPHPSCPTRLPENVDHFNIEPYPCSSNMAPPSYVASALLICR